MGISELVFELQELKAKIKGVFNSCTVAMITCYIKDDRKLFINDWAFF